MKSCDEDRQEMYFMVAVMIVMLLTLIGLHYG